ncbi:MAG: hypothetical protein EPO32_07595 [Anaerolineae bacterium]|nr:MAG: hypothetical protein EPO32_07595 [Anaerolineae bacterium]
MNDLDLIRRYEPVLRFTRGEQFFPIRATDYLRRCSLWLQRPGEEPRELVTEGHLSPATLGDDRPAGFGSVQYLKFIDPLNIAELAAYRLRTGFERRSEDEVFHPGPGRLARVGYTARFIDAIFSLTLLARGRVPGDTAAAAALVCRQMDAEPAYHARVLKQEGWIILQYWVFFPFNNWRSGFFGANDHEADWEMLCIYLADRPNAEPQPEWVAYASHEFEGDELRRRWDDPELHKEQGTHPVVYTGAGSHAAYFQPGEYMTEIELAFLSPLARLAEFAQRIGRNLTRLAQGQMPRSQANHVRVNTFRVPFIDYARGDGQAIGPGQPRPWGAPEPLTPTPDWVKGYRGLWGLFVRDQFAGENAPAGPMYNRDGSVRRAWFDPLGWAGLDKVAPQASADEAVAVRTAELETETEALRRSIQANSQRLHTLGIEQQAMYGRAHMRHIYLEHGRQIQSLSQDLATQRGRLTENRALLESLGRYAARLGAGERAPAQAHLAHPHRPIDPQELTIGRVAELWSAMSIGLMMMLFVGLVLFARQALFVGAAGLVVLLTLIEAGARRRLRSLLHGLTIVLAVLSGLVLLYEFFWPLVEVGLVLAGAYIMWENIRELANRR